MTTRLMDRKYWQSFQMQAKKHVCVCLFAWRKETLQLLQDYSFLPTFSFDPENMCSEVSTVPCSWAGVKDSEISPEQMPFPGFTEALPSRLAQLSSPEGFPAKWCP